MAEKQIILTQSGLEKLERELEELKSVKRKEIAEKIKVALSFGDLSEKDVYKRQVHEHLGALSGLGVLIGHVMLFRVVADVGEVLLHRLADRHLAERGPEQLGKLLRVGLGAARRAEARHGDGEDAVPGQAEQLLSLIHI